MKTNSLKLIAALFLAGFSVSTASVARPAQARHESHPGRGEVQAYLDAKVLPVVRQQRQKLETQLAADDSAQLATYRTQLQALRARGQALFQAIRANQGPEGAWTPPTDAQREQMHRLHEENRSIMLKLGEMAQRYRDVIGKLSEEVQPQREKWSADIRAIVLKSATPEQQQRMANFAGPMRMFGGMPHLFRPSRFLLMEPGAATLARDDERSLGATSFYPNPAAATTQLEFDLKKEGPVTVELLDQNGNKLRTLLNETYAAKGQHTQQLDLHDLPAGTYFYKITANGASETKRFVKE